MGPRGTPRRYSCTYVSKRMTTALFPTRCTPDHHGKHAPNIPQESIKFSMYKYISLLIYSCTRYLCSCGLCDVAGARLPL